jgi:hypothetical protein
MENGYLQHQQQSQDEEWVSLLNQLNKHNYTIGVAQTKINDEMTKPKSRCKDDISYPLVITLAPSTEAAIDAIETSKPNTPNSVPARYTGLQITTTPFH